MYIFFIIYSPHVFGNLVTIHFLCMEESTISFGVPLKKERVTCHWNDGFQFLGELSSWTIKSFTNTVLGFCLLVSLTCKSDRFRFITETLRNMLLQQPCPNLLPAVQAPHAICMPLEQFTLSAALKGIYIFCLQWASPFFRLSEPLPPVVLPLSSLPVLSWRRWREEEKRGIVSPEGP